MNIKDAIITLGSYIRQKEKAKIIPLSYNLCSKKGIEIGGPSPFFSLKGHFPVYLFAKTIDGINYSNNTIWEGHISEGENYHYYNKVGYQYIREASDLSGIKDNNYDFVLSCHSLEHVANPLKALTEWKRILRQNGYLILVLPNKNFSFDYKREYTTMQHLISDFENDITENDHTHFEEVLNTLDEKTLADATLMQETVEKVHKNFENRSVHHHVFDWKLINEMLEWAGFEVKKQIEARLHMFTIAQKK